MFLRVSAPTSEHQNQQNDNDSLSSSSYSSSKSSQDFSRHNSYDFQDEEKYTPTCDTNMRELPVLPLTPPPYWSLSRSQSQSSTSSIPAQNAMLESPISNRTRMQNLQLCEKPLPPLPEKIASFSIHKPLPPLPDGKNERNNDDIYFCLKELEDWKVDRTSYF